MFALLVSLGPDHRLYMRIESSRLIPIKSNAQTSRLVGSCVRRRAASAIVDEIVALSESSPF